MEAILAQHLCKVYPGGVKALDDLNMSVREGEIFTLLGPNGAGKSTLINILTTYLTPTAGSVQVFGKDITRQAHWIRQQIACVAQKPSIDNHLSLLENMRFQSRLYHLDGNMAAKRIDELIQSLSLEEYTRQRVAAYSGGIKRRLDIAMSLVSRPRLLFLDEPTLALDVESRKAVWEIVRKIRHEGTSVLMTTHYLEEAEALSDSICIIKNGRELIQDSPQNLRRYTRQNLIQVILNTPAAASQLEQLLLQQNDVESIQNSENKIIAAVQNKNDGLLKINRLLLEQAVSYCSVGILEPSLETVFLTLTRTAKESV